MRRLLMRFEVVVLCLCVKGLALPGFAEFRIWPYVQNPAPRAITLTWFSAERTPGQVSYWRQGDPSMEAERLASVPEHAPALAYPDWEAESFFAGAAPAAPYRHRIRLTGLEPDTRYVYTVEHGGDRFDATFRTAPGGRRAVRFIVFADSETEPESTGDHVSWADPTGKEPDRTYLLDQTEGYAANLQLIAASAPDFFVVAGDLVESGGEQRDWDEFWRHLTGPVGTPNLASRVPLLAAPGNHDYYEGPQLGRYGQPGSEHAINRFKTYLEPPGTPPGGYPPDIPHDCFYRLDYGPVTLLVLDVANGFPHRSEHDTNFYLLGEMNSNGGSAPDFNPGSRQYAWLETQLREAQSRSLFTFVVFHHVPYSVGPHGWPAGDADGQDTQSGRPVRALTPLFMRYGVDAVICGHDEIWERSVVTGEETRTSGERASHHIHFYDVGTGGDGLRGPEDSLDNPYQEFLAHHDAPEQWEDGVLIDGGKHYGHLEVDVLPLDSGRWQAVLKPVYSFPLFNAEGAYLGPERRLYDDLVTLTTRTPTTASTGAPTTPAAPFLAAPYPNPFNGSVLIRYGLTTAQPVRIEIMDVTGQKVCRLIQGDCAAGYHSLEWDGRDSEDRPVASGVYMVTLSAESYRDTAKVTLVR